MKIENEITCGEERKKRKPEDGTSMESPSCHYTAGTGGLS